MSSDGEAKHEAGLLAVATMVVWCGCVLVGLIGMHFSLRRAMLAGPAAPVDAELLNVEAIQQRQAESIPPPAAAPPDSPAVAAPSPAIAFAEAVDAPVHLVETPRITATEKSVIRLTYGEGEGQQPAPEYPPEAVRAGQEGTIVVRMTVSEDGRVTQAEAVTPCPWPVLNSAAVRAVRSTWRFRRGPVRIYEVSIQFQINRHE
ncbi:MAG: energy transducer TonB [Tepidisphaeraceae bacterium]|jgi:periplasmic protein TonB